jgi:hypothetical protein
VEAGDALAAADEGHERRLPRLVRRIIARRVEEEAGRVVQEDRVVVRQVLRVDVGGVVADRGGPGAGLLAELLDKPRGERDRRVDEAARRREDEDLPRLLRLRRRPVRERGHHRIHVLRARHARVAAPPAALSLGDRGTMTPSCCAVIDPALPYRLPRTNAEGARHLIAGERAILVGVQRPNQRARRTGRGCRSWGCGSLGRCRLWCRGRLACARARSRAECRGGRSHPPCALQCVLLAVNPESIPGADLLRAPRAEADVTRAADIARTSRGSCTRRPWKVETVLTAVVSLPVLVVDRAAYAGRLRDADKRIAERDPDDVDPLALAPRPGAL